MDFASIFLAETVGTAMLLLLGGGTVANVALAKTKGVGAGFLFVNVGWGLAVMMGVLVSYQSGGHLNPAVTLGLAISGTTFTAGQVAGYLLGQFLGALIGAFLVWVVYRDHFDAEEDAATKLGVFSTAPGIRNPIQNMIVEAIATFVLVFVIIAGTKFTDFATEGSGTGPANLGWLGALGVALLIVVIGIALGGPTGYAINPVRDLCPRIIHAIVPIKGKGGSDWGYAWVPVVGPLIGGALAGALSWVLLA